MDESFKNFIALIIAAGVWSLGIFVLLGWYGLFKDGPTINEFISVLAFTSALVIVISLCRKSKRLKAALEFSLFH